MYFRPGGRDDRERYQYSFLTVQRYLTMKCQKKNPSQFFEKYQMKKIAIYGLGELAKCLLNDLAESSLEVEYIVDQAYASYPNGYRGIPVIGVGDIKEQKDVDVMVVTVLYEFNQIVDSLLEQQIPLDNIINMNDIVYSL